MKYFYDDALEAAYMCKHHGMKFHTADDDKWFGKGGDTPEGITVWLNVTGGRRLYLNEDCYDLLLPQIGDLVFNGEIYYIWEGKSLPQKFASYHFIGVPGDRLSGTSKIIQRNGRAFFTPEKSLDAHLPTVHIDEFLK